MVEHKPVLYQESIDFLRPRAGGQYIDGTIDRRAIVGSTVVSSTIEQLSIDLASSQALTQANVSQIRYLMRFRLATDTLDFIHEFVSNVGFVNVTIVEVIG